MSNNSVEQQQLEKDKKSICMHPLFPLLKFLFEKCELATLSPEAVNQEALHEELKAFIDQNEENLKPMVTQNKVVDELVLKSIQVLRIHLLELEKVNELCKDFCQRYISCLKIKLNSDNIFKNEFDSTNFSGDDCNNENFEDTDDMDDENLSFSFTNNNQASANANEESMQQFGHLANSSLNESSAGIFNNILNSSSSSSNIANTGISGNTPLSQIGCNELNNALLTNSALENFEFDDDSTSKHKTKRGILPKNATNIMKQWLFQHIVHPYPTEDEKKQIAVQTNLTLIQVNNWFINARRRILQPMLEASNPDMAKKKKSSTISSKPYQNNRYWPPSLVNIALKSTNSSNSHSSSLNTKAATNIDKRNIKTDVDENEEIDIDDDDEEVDEEADEEEEEEDGDNSSSNNNNYKNMNNNTARNMCNALKVENLLNNDPYQNHTNVYNQYDTMAHTLTQLQSTASLLFQPPAPLPPTITTNPGPILPPTASSHHHNILNT